MKDYYTGAEAFHSTWILWVGQLWKCMSFCVHDLFWWMWYNLYTGLPILFHITHSSQKCLDTYVTKEIEIMIITMIMLIIIILPIFYYR